MPYVAPEPEFGPSLPKIILFDIFRELEPCDIANLSRVCQGFAPVLQDFLADQDARGIDFGDLPAPERPYDVSDSDIKQWQNWLLNTRDFFRLSGKVSHIKGHWPWMNILPDREPRLVAVLNDIRELLLSPSFKIETANCHEIYECVFKSANSNSDLSFYDIESFAATFLARHADSLRCLEKDLLVAWKNKFAKLKFPHLESIGFQYFEDPGEQAFSQDFVWSGPSSNTYETWSNMLKTFLTNAPQLTTFHLETSDLHASLVTFPGWEVTCLKTNIWNRRFNFSFKRLP